MRFLSKPGQVASPSEMLEELAEKVIGQMERRSITSFESALAEMIDFHRFLLAANVSKDSSGQFFSFAELGDWIPVYQDWMRQYHKLFVRSAQLINENEDFIEALFRSSLRLLPHDGNKASQIVTANTLDLASMAAHQLASWRSENTISLNGRATPRELPELKKSKYDSVLMSFVGAFEDHLKYALYIYKWNEQKLSEEEKWSRYCNAWKFLARHLHNAAYILAIAVWNEDEVGAQHYSDVLLRWLTTLSPSLRPDYYLSEDSITPDLFEMDWQSAQVALKAHITFPGEYKLTPERVFPTVLAGVLSDVIFCLVGVIVSWSFERTSTQGVALSIAERLLSGKSFDDSSRPAIASSFAGQFVKFVRMFLVGESFARVGYARWLDDLIAKLDGLTERRVVPGRVYMVKSKSGRRELIDPWLSVLLDKRHPKDFVYPDQKIERLFATFQSTERGLDRLSSVKFYARGASEALNRDAGSHFRWANNQTESYIEKGHILKSLFDQLHSKIEAIEDALAKSLPLDTEKLSTLALRIDQALRLPDSYGAIFFGVEVVGDEEELENILIRIPHVDRGFFTLPPVGDVPINIEDSIVHQVVEETRQRTYREFWKIRKREIIVSDRDSLMEVLSQEAERISSAGDSVALLVRDWQRPDFVAPWFEFEPKEDISANVRQDPLRKSPLYIGTMNGINVYRGSGNDQEVYLYSEQALRRVQYGTIGGRRVKLSFSEQNDERVMNVEFSRTLSWAHEEIVVIRLAA